MNPEQIYSSEETNPRGKKIRQLKKFDQEGTEGHITEIHARHNWEE